MLNRNELGGFRPEAVNTPIFGRRVERNVVGHG